MKMKSKFFVRILLLFPLFFLINQKILASDESENIENNKIFFEGKSESIYQLLQKEPRGKNGAIIFFITPNIAPRFENFPNLIYDGIMGKGYKGAIFAIIHSEKYYMTIDYLRERKYPFNCIIDSTGTIFKELNIPLYAPFITRWDSSGNIQYSICIGGQTLDSNLWSDIIYSKKVYPPAKNSISIAKKGYILDTFSLQKIQLTKSINLQEDSLHPNGKFFKLDISENEKLLVASDYSVLKNKIFSLNEGKLISVLYPDINIRRFFSKNVPDYIFNQTENDNYARTMLFQSRFLDNKNIITIAVLPEVQLKPKNNDTTISLANKYVILNYNLVKNKFSEPIPIIFTMNEITSPYDLIFMSDVKNNEFAMTFSKGYPAKGFSTADTANGNNPIDKSFYTDTPLYYTYDIKTGETKRKIGKLWGANEKLGVGYGLGGSQLCSNSSTYFYTSALSPYVETGNNEKIPLKTYYPKDLMEPGDPPKELPTFDKIQQLSDSIGAFIVSMATSDKYLYTIWRLKESGETLLNSNIYILQKYDLNSKNLIGEWIIPGVIDGRKLNSYMIEPNKNKLIGIYYNSRETYVNFFDIK